jgi:hypothetical protein
LDSDACGFRRIYHVPRVRRVIRVIRVIRVRIEKKSPDNIHAALPGQRLHSDQSLFHFT